MALDNPTTRAFVDAFNAPLSEQKKALLAAEYFGREDPEPARRIAAEIRNRVQIVSLNVDGIAEAYLYCDSDHTAEISDLRAALAQLAALASALEGGRL